MNFKLDIGIWYLLTNPLVDEMIYGSQNKLCKVWVITRCQNNFQATIAKVEKLTRLGRHLAGGQPLQCDNSPGGTKAFLCWDPTQGHHPCMVTIIHISPGTTKLTLHTINAHFLRPLEGHPPITTFPCSLQFMLDQTCSGHP